MADLVVPRPDDLTLLSNLFGLLGSIMVPVFDRSSYGSPVHVYPEPSP